MLKRDKGNKNSRFAIHNKQLFFPPPKFAAAQPPRHRSAPAGSPPEPVPVRPPGTGGFTTFHPGCRPHHRAAVLRQQSPLLVFSPRSASALAHLGLFSYLCSRLRAVFRPSRAHSSVGQSSGLIIRRSWDHAPLGPQQRPQPAGCGLFAICNRAGDPSGERIFEPCLRKVAKNCYLCDIKQTSYLWNSKEPSTK